MDSFLLRVKRQSKKARVFEIQKLVKQIRVLESRKGTDAQLQKAKRKVERLVQVLDAIKDLDLSSFAEEVCQLLEEGAELPNSRGAGEQVFDGTTCAERAKHRLLTNKTFQRNITKLSKSNLAQTTGKRIGTEIIEDKLLEVVMTKTRTQVMRGTNTGTNERGDSVHSEDSVSDGAEATADGEEVSSLGTETERVVEQTLADSSEDESCNLLAAEVCVKDTKEVSGRKYPCVSERSPIAVKGSVEKQESVSCGSDMEDRVPKKQLLESTFIGALSASPHLPSSSNRSSHTRRAAKKVRANRPGQRTRQKKWEMMFGEKAKHIVVQGKKWRKRELKERRTTKRTKEKSLPVSHSPKEEAMARTSTAQQLHPSWEAQRRKRAREAAIPQFLGQKTVFSD